MKGYFFVKKKKNFKKCVIGPKKPTSKRLSFSSLLGKFMSRPIKIPLDPSKKVDYSSKKKKKKKWTNLTKFIRGKQNL